MRMPEHTTGLNLFEGMKLIVPDLSAISSVATGIL